MDATTKVAETCACVLRLLQELDGACQAAGIDYVCAGGVPRALGEGTAPDFDEGAILVRAQDMPALVDYLSAHLPAERAIEYYGTNPAYPALTARYADTGTVLYDCGAISRYEHSCLNVAIVPLRGRRKLRGLLGYREQACTVNEITDARIAAAGGVAEGAKLRLARMLQRSWRSMDDVGRDALFRRFCAAYSFDGAGDAWARCRSSAGVGADGQVPAGVLEGTVRADLCGVELSLPRDLDAFVDALYPVKDGKRAFPPARNAYTVASAQVPFAQMRAYLEAGPDLTDEIRADKATMSAMRKRVSKRAPIVGEVWTLAKRLYADEGGEA